MILETDVKAQNTVGWHALSMDSKGVENAQGNLTSGMRTTAFDGRNSSR